ncbi:hypothetical protein [Methylopila turkensis]|uniref:Outer membrane protein beta-barrel domain-containing protein n=1 Tax=Methylopila turkensis TaxID=1437816 RepID=A0A9W6N8F7_9HYPH|nr:hypothetical protein [Methylopila turkensis]GLK81460.1 hypothetical protein GCM10008174_32010 [Methylopila turkensis]
MSMKAALLSSAAMWFAVCPGAAWAADFAVEAGAKPAVDAINGKLEGFGGWADGRFGRDGFSGGALGSLTVPLGDRFGAQIDGLAAVKDGDFVGGGAGHLFTRDPDRFLFGLYGSGVGFDDRVNSWNVKIGAEGELYFDRFTLSAVLGYERLGGGSDRVGARRIERASKGGSFFDYADLSYYVTDDWKVSVGHRYTGRKHAAAFGTEARLPFGAVPVSAFVEGRLGEDDYKAVWGGLKVYFGGEDKPLIARHRESDPPNWLKDDLFSTRTKRRSLGAAPTPPTDPELPCGCGGPCPCGPET